MSYFSSINQRGHTDNAGNEKNQKQKKKKRREEGWKRSTSSTRAKCSERVLLVSSMAVPFEALRSKLQVCVVCSLFIIFFFYLVWSIDASIIDVVRVETKTTHVNVLNFKSRGFV